VITPFLPWIPAVRLPGINPLNILLGSVFLTFALHRVLNRQKVFRPGRLTFALNAIIVVAALSVVRGAALPTGYYFDAASAGIDVFRSAVTFSVYFIVLAMAQGERDRRWLSWSIVLGLVAESLVTIAYGRNGSGARAEGSIGQSNELGAFLALSTVFTAALLPATRVWFARLLMLGATAAGAYGVILSVSRGAVLALVLGLGYVAIRSSRVMALILLAVLLTSPLWTPDYLKQRIMGTEVEVEGTDESTLEGSAQIRIDTWKAITKIVTEHPLDGVGFTGLEFVLPEAGSALGMEVKDSAHNTYLRFLAEMGILGLVLFCYLLWRCLSLAHAGIRAATTVFDRQLGVGLAAATLALAASCAFGDRFFNILISGNFWILCALVNDVVLERQSQARAIASERVALAERGVT
jgi:O-antigen ligase